MTERMDREGPERTEHEGPAAPTADTSALISSLEADQLTAARAHHYPRRQLKPKEAILLWSLRIYLLFMVGVVIYQVFTTVR